MLYPKREQKLTGDEFKNPTREYRATPFWAWNTALDKDELTRQIDVFKEIGYGGFHMHVRTGLATEYLSDEYMDIVRACVEKARKEGMLPWLYDEDRWPSGAAGGLVTKNPAYRIRHLLLTRLPYGTGGAVMVERKSRASSNRCENGTLAACFDITLDSGGALASYRPIGESDAARGFKLYAYAETARPNPWFNNQTYVDTLNPATIREFIRVTYERYGAYFEKDFGSLIHAIFTDEPQFSKKGTLNYAREDKDVTLPWTPDIEDTYRAAYNGESLTGGLPELLWDLCGGRVSKIRYHYHDHIAERFAAAFADQCGAWCAKHGIMLTGHMMEEPSLESQTNALGEAMRSYRSFQLPGIDMLCDRHEFTTAKQAQSAARQIGCPGTLSELYGVTNWDFDFRGHKLQGDWQAALGVTVRVPHLSWVSMNGEAKRDYPAYLQLPVPLVRTVSLRGRSFRPGRFRHDPGQGDCPHRRTAPHRKLLAPLGPPGKHRGHTIRPGSELPEPLHLAAPLSHRLRLYLRIHPAGVVRQHTGHQSRRLPRGPDALRYRHRSRPGDHKERHPGPP